MKYLFKVKTKPDQSNVLKEIVDKQRKTSRVSCIYDAWGCYNYIVNDQPTADALSHELRQAGITKTSYRSQQ